ncbi:MAG TPA: hypothetical protein VFW90_03450 [Candidatus Saccharimonadales bacterium]|nr:hypothetical protein [Candidatus Saccharimonadales bacterium]
MGEEASGEGLTNLSGEIEKQLKALRIREGRASQVDPHRLAAELADIEFNPLFATDLPDIRLDLGQWSPEIHQTRNFPLIFAAADKILRGKGANILNPVESDVAQEFTAANYGEILRRLKTKYPALYRRMREVADNLEEQRQLSTDPRVSQEERDIRAATDEETAEWDYISSMTYNEAAALARTMNESYDLERLYLSPRPGH